MIKILIADDEVKYIELLKEILIDEGFEVCEKIRKKSNVPILMLTALSDSENEIKGLNCGANGS